MIDIPTGRDTLPPAPRPRGVATFRTLGEVTLSFLSLGAPLRGDGKEVEPLVRAPSLPSFSPEPAKPESNEWDLVP